MAKMKKIPYLYSKISKDEQILWGSKPNKKCMVLEAVFNFLLPFALIWALIDLSIFSMMLRNMQGSNIQIFSLEAGFPFIFIMIHMMPVWIYLYGVLFSGLKYKNTEYIITDKAVYALTGALFKKIKMKKYNEISDVRIHRGLFDQKLHLGDVEIIDYNDFYYSKNGKHYNKLCIEDIPDYQVVFEMILKNRADALNRTFYDEQNIQYENNNDYNFGNYSKDDMDDRRIDF